MNSVSSTVSSPDYYSLFTAGGKKGNLDVIHSSRQFHPQTSIKSLAPRTIYKNWWNDCSPWLFKHGSFTARQHNISHLSFDWFLSSEKMENVFLVVVFFVGVLSSPSLADEDPNHRHVEVGDMVTQDK